MHCVDELRCYERRNVSAVYNLIRRTSSRGGFPWNKISRISKIPKTVHWSYVYLTLGLTTYDIELNIGLSDKFVLLLADTYFERC